MNYFLDAWFKIMGENIGSLDPIHSNQISCHLILRACYIFVRGLKEKKNLKNTINANE